MADFDAGSIGATLELDRSPFTAGLKQAQLDGDKFAKQKFAVSLSLDTTSIDAQMEELRTKYANSTFNIGVNLDLGDSDAKVQNLKDKISGIGGTEGIGLNFDLAKFDVDINYIARQLDNLGPVRIGIDFGDIDGQLALIQAKIDALHGGHVDENIGSSGGVGADAGSAASGALGSIGNGILGGVVSGVSGAALAALVGGGGEALLAGATASVLGLGSAFTVAGAAAAPFFGVVMGDFTKMTAATTAVTTAQKELTSATTDAARAKGIADLAAAEKGLAGPLGVAAVALGTIKSAWTQLENSTAPVVFGLMTKAFDDVAGVIPKLAPLVNAMAQALDPVLTKLNASITGPGFTKFITFVTSNLKPVIADLSAVLGNFGSGFIDMMEVAQPLIAPVLGGLVGISQAFKDFATSPAFKEFIQWLIQQMPAVSALLQNLFSLLVPILKLFEPMIAPVEMVLNALITGIKNILAGPVGPAFATLFKDIVAAVMPLIPYLERMIDAVLPPLGLLFGSVIKAVAPLLPLIAQLITTLLPPAIAFFQQIVTALTPLIPIFVQMVQQLLPPFLTAFEALLKTLTPMLPLIVQFVTMGMQGLFEVLMVVLPLLTDLFNSFAQDKVAMGLLLLGLMAFIAPWSTLVLVIGVAIDYIHEHWGQIVSWFDNTWNTIVSSAKQQWQNFYNAVISPLVKIADWIWSFIQEIGGWFANEWNTLVKNTEQQWNEFYSAMISPLVKAADWVSNFVVNIPRWFQGLWQNVVGIANSFGNILYSAFVQPFQSAWNWITQTWRDAASWFSGIFSDIVNAAGNILGGIGNIAGDAFSGIGDGLKWAINEVVGWVNWAIDRIDSIGVSVPSWVPGIGGDWFGFDIPEIPYLATGGILPNDGHAVVGENGPELLDLRAGRVYSNSDSLLQMKNINQKTTGSNQTEQTQALIAANATLTTALQNAIGQMAVMLHGDLVSIPAATGDSVGSKIVAATKAQLAANTVAARKGQG